MTDSQALPGGERIESSIFFIRGQRVMLGIHLAEIYEIEHEALDRIIERNMERFPADCIFRLSHEELASLIPGHSCQTYAFTGHGVAILSSLLFDEREIHEDSDSCAPTCACHKRGNCQPT